MNTFEKATLAVLGTAMFAGIGYLSYRSETDPDRGPTWVREGQKRAAAEALAQLRGQFSGPVARWLAASDLKVAAPGQRIMAKVVLIDSKQRTVDEAHMNLPAPLKATRPDEVQTLVFLDWGRRQVLTYASGDKGFVQTCSVRVVDLAQRTVIAQATFEGPSPRDMKRLGTGDQQGDKPLGAILSFLTARFAAGASPKTEAK